METVTVELCVDQFGTKALYIDDYRVTGRDTKLYGLFTAEKFEIDRNLILTALEQ